MKRFRCYSGEQVNSMGWLSHFSFRNSPNILYWGQVRAADWPIQHLYPLPLQPCLCKVVLHCLVENALMSLEKMLSFVLLCINAAIIEV